MALLISPQPGTADIWRRAFAAAMPDLDVRVWPEVGDAASIEVAAVGSIPAGALAKLPNLRLILSLTAGVDTLLSEPSLPAVPIARTADLDGDAMMNETVLLHVLRHHRYMPDYLQAQQRCEWIRRPIKPARERAVGVMGLGSVELGPPRPSLRSDSGSPAGCGNRARATGLRFSAAISSTPSWRAAKSW